MLLKMAKARDNKALSPACFCFVLLSFPITMSLPETIYLMVILLPPQSNHDTCQRGSRLQQYLALKLEGLAGDTLQRTLAYWHAGHMCLFDKDFCGQTSSGEIPVQCTDQLSKRYSASHTSVSTRRAHAICAHTITIFRRKTSSGEIPVQCTQASDTACCVEVKGRKKYQSELRTSSKHTDSLSARNGLGSASATGNIIASNSSWFVAKCTVWYYTLGWYRGRNESLFYCLTRLKHVESALSKSRNETLSVSFSRLFINFISRQTHTHKLRYALQIHDPGSMPYTDVCCLLAIKNRNCYRLVYPWSMSMF